MNNSVPIVLIFLEKPELILWDVDTRESYVVSNLTSVVGDSITE
jgi:hypothetical protein